jgi:hypothetical protein
VARFPLVRPLATYAVGVVGVEVGAVSAGIGDVVGETGQPLQWVHGLEVSPERGVHAGAVEHGFAAVEVDELLEREGRTDEIAGQVLDGLLVLERDRLGDVGGEAPDASGRPPQEAGNGEHDVAMGDGCKHLLL